MTRLAEWSAGPLGHLADLGRLTRFVWTHPLNAPHRLAALGRVVRWQVASRLVDGAALPFVEDTRLLTRRGMTGATGNWYCGLHELPEMAFVLHLLRPGDHFLDVGANVGSYTVLAAGGAGARATAVEPIPETFAHLERNVALNGLGARVRACPVGLSRSAGVLRFTRSADAVNRVLLDGEDLPAVEVPVHRLDDLVGGDAPVLIKIDVEGHEAAVLDGAARTLADPRVMAVVMETNGSGARYGTDDAELTAAMRAHGFSTHGYDPFARRLLAPMPSRTNTLFVREPSAVERRARESRHYRLVNGRI